MPIDLTQDAYTQFRSIATERTTPIVAWVGSGLSVPAGLPTWPKLRESLLDAAKHKASTMNHDGKDQLTPKIRLAESALDPWLAFDFLKRVLGSTSYRETVRGVLGGASTAAIPQSYLQLWRLKISGVITLNLDRLVTRAFTHLNPGAAPLEFNGNETANWLHVLRTPHPFIANMHGVTDDTSSWALTKDELKVLFDTGGYDEFIAACLASRCVLFLGLSADDIAVGGHLERLSQRGIKSGPHFWLTERADQRTDEWAEKVGVRVIRYDARGNDHSAVDLFFQDLLGFVPSDDVADPVTLPIAAPTEIAAPKDLLREDAEVIRNALNARAAEILGGGSPEEYERYREFCRQYNQAIYRAWYVDLDAGDNVLLGYTLDDRAGSGAFGTVYRATALNGETVAIKLLHEDVRRTPEMLESFRRGVRSMKILTGADLKGIVRYREASEIPALVVMDWVDGPNLRELIHAKQLNGWRDILRVILSLTRIVRSAHALPQRVLHRDLRPANIMLSDYWADRDDWQLIVLDFDLSYHVGSQEKTIDLRGDSANGYLAPEQLQRIPNVSTRNAAVDSFGLGMTAYYVIAHRDPYPAEHMHSNWRGTVELACRAHTCTEWLSLPARMARVIMSCTRHEQVERWDLAQVQSEVDRLSRLLDAGARHVMSAELVAEELVARASPSGDYDWNYDAMAARITLASGLAITITADEAREKLSFTADWASSGALNRREVIRWLPNATRAATELLQSGGWTVQIATANQQTIHLSAEATVAAVLENLDRAAEVVGRVAQKLTFK